MSGYKFKIAGKTARFLVKLQHILITILGYKSYRRELGFSDLKRETERKSNSFPVIIRLEFWIFFLGFKANSEMSSKQ